MSTWPSNFKPPGSFVNCIGPGRRYQLSIPEPFRGYLKCTSKKIIAIFKRGDLTWKVKIADDWLFGEGWEDFVRDNGVEDGNVVVYKHVSDMVFETMVFDTSLCERNYPTYQATNAGREIPKGKDTCNLRTSSSSKPGSSGAAAPLDRYFGATATELYHWKNCVNVPLGFAKSNGLNRNCEMTVMDEKQRYWPLRLRNRKLGDHVHISKTRGMLFANGIKLGDKFSLELLDNGDKPLMKLHSGSSGNGRDRGGPRGLIDEENDVKNVDQKVDPMKEVTSQDTNAGKEIPKGKDTCTVRTSSSSKPGSSGAPALPERYFEATATELYHRKNCVNVPLGFAKSNGLNRNCDMTVMDEKQRYWPLRLRNRKLGDHVHIRKTRGMLFANGIKLGDKFSLDLVDNGDKPLMMLHSGSSGNGRGRGGPTSLIDEENDVKDVDQKVDPVKAVTSKKNSQCQQKYGACMRWSTGQGGPLKRRKSEMGNSFEYGSCIDNPIDV